MKCAKTDLIFPVENGIAAMLKDKYGHVFFIHAISEVMLTKLIKKCERRGATLVARGGV